MKEYVFHIAVNGNDAWAGTKAKPFSSLNRGLQAVRRIKSNDQKRLIIGAGRYYEINLALGAQDSGLTIEAGPDEEVLLCGGRRITGWKKDGEKFWSAALPEVKEGKWNFRALVVNGRLARRARYPREGYLSHRNEFKVRWLSTTAGGWERPPTTGELTTMKYDPKDLPDRLEIKNAEITVYHSWDESLVGVAAMDNEKVTFANPAGYPPGAFGIKKYVVWNIEEGLSEPGQWFLDRANGCIVYWPLESENIGDLEAVAPTTETIIRCEGTTQNPIKDIIIRGICFAVTNTPLIAGGFGAKKFAGALSFVSAEHCQLRNCSISGTAGQGIKISASSDIVIRECSLRETGAGGIVMDSKDSVISHNHISNTGRIYPCGIGVSISGQSNSIAANRIENTLYTAIACGGNGHLIENNVIRNFMQELDDGAAIYITFCKNVIVRHNQVIGPHRYSAYYIDEQGENCLIEKNIAFDSSWPSHNHMARNCILRNNVFHSRGEMKLTFPKSSGFIMEKNVLHARGPITISRAVWWDAAAVEQKALAAMPNNIFFSRGGVIEEDLAGAQTDFAPRDGTVMKDPLFRKPDRGDFSFLPGSPAHELGIKPLVMNAIITSGTNHDG